MGKSGKNPTDEEWSEAAYLRAAVESAGEAGWEEGQFRLRVQGESMHPLLRSGNVVVAEAVGSGTLCRGELVVVKLGGNFITHRLVGREGANWVTKGDNHRYADPPVPPEAILGRVVALERGNKRISIREGHWGRANRWMGRISAMEAQFFRVGRSLRKGRNPLVLWSAAARLAGIPFRLLGNALVFLARK